MKKLIHILLIVNLLINISAKAQTILIAENFDKLVAGPGQQIPAKWTAKNANNDFASWDIIANNANNPTNAQSAPNAGVMAFGINGNDDYLISQMVPLKKGISYKIRFSYKTVSASTSFEKMSVFVTADTTVATMSKVAPNFTNDLITNTDFEKIEFVFKPTTDAPHALVFHSYSDPIMFLTIIDDIEMLGPTVPTQDLETITLQVAPNPATESITIQSNEIMEEVSIFDIQGKMIQKLNPSSSKTELDVSQFPKGQYLLRIKNKDFQTISKKITVQ